MALLEDRTTAFIVRIWCERGDTSSLGPEWRGSVEHIHSGERSFFRHLDAVIDFMKPYLEALGIDAQRRFWERISAVMDDEEGDPAEFRIDVDAGMAAAASESSAASTTTSSTAASVHARKSR